MRVRVREVEPPADTQGLEELVAPGAPGDGRTATSTRSDGGPTVALPAAPGRRTGARDFGPNGEVVLDLLARAARLTADERRRLEHELAWRWGFQALATTVIAPAASSMPVGRALAVARGRADGRADAIAALDAAVAALMRDQPRTRSRAMLSVCIANAGLAVLVRDLVDLETFEVLFGPWREVMHH